MNSSWQGEWSQLEAKVQKQLGELIKDETIANQSSTKGSGSIDGQYDQNKVKLKTTLVSLKKYFD